MTTKVHAANLKSIYWEIISSFFFFIVKQLQKYVLHFIVFLRSFVLSTLMKFRLNWISLLNTFKWLQIELNRLSPSLHSYPILFCGDKNDAILQIQKFETLPRSKSFIFSKKKFVSIELIWFSLVRLDRLIVRLKNFIVFTFKVTYFWNSSVESSVYVSVSLHSQS